MVCNVLLYDDMQQGIAVKYSLVIAMIEISQPLDDFLTSERPKQIAVLPYVGAITLVVLSSSSKIRHSAYSYSRLLSRNCCSSTELMSWCTSPSKA